MKIRYQPRRGTVEIELRDIIGGNPLAKWHVGDEREIPAGAKVIWGDGNAPAHPIDAAEAIFRHGPDFVDAATGKNPLYTCADCGAEALEEHAFDYDHDRTIPFVNDAGKRLCAACWLGAHPELIPNFEFHRSWGKERPDDIKRAKAIATKRAASPAPQSDQAKEEQK
jgi:hypothetical protein